MQQPQARFFAEGGFFANEGKAKFIAPEIPALRTETTAARPLRLNTGRIRDQWHTMTRTGASPRLGQHLPEPFVEVHPDDAARHGVADGGFARVTTDYGQCTLRVVVSERQQRGMLFAPIHWSEVTATGRAWVRWWPRTPIHFPASPRTRRRRRRLRRTNMCSGACAVAHAAECPRMPGGRASPSMAAMAICWPTMPILRVAILARLDRRRRSRRIHGFWRRCLSRGVLRRGPD
jgi:Uncharacterized anaerobic dehydrogenase